jgi:predicted exporter
VSSRGVAVALWLALVTACAAIALNARYTADMSAFLPRLATPLQQLLAEQLRDGVVSRLLLIGIEGGSADARAAASRNLARDLAAQAGFVYVANGDAQLAARDRDLLFAHRYVLSPRMVPERFTEAGLRAALADAYELLASPAGTLVRRYLPADPTGELLALLGALQGQTQPQRHDGVWTSRDGATALALAQVAAPGYDIDAQAGNVSAVSAAFARARDAAGDPSLRLVLTGPAVFAVQSRDAIRADAERLSMLAAIAVALMLFAAFRSVKLVVLALVPVATGALAGLAAVALGFGTVHGITLGFGITLIGEAVDYAIYAFARRDAPSLAPTWRTLRLGAMLSAASFCAMLFSGFPGLAQLGLFSVAGLVAALATTQLLLPHFMGHAPLRPGALRLANVLPRGRTTPAAWRLAVPLLVIAGGAAAIAWHAPVWDDALERLSPVSREAQLTDQRLRDELGAPDVRFLAVVSAPTPDDVLARAESLEPALARWIADGVLTRYESPARFLPSRATQAARAAALPAPEVLRERLARALADSPFAPDGFAPFLRDAAAARDAPPVTLETLRGTALGLRAESLVTGRDGAWQALLPLAGVPDEARLRAAIAELGRSDVALLDFKGESTTLMRTYRGQALLLWAAGGAAIVLLLAWHLRSAARVLRVILPIVAAVVGTAGIVLATGASLTIFHLVALLLVAGIGSNYALFFEQPPPDERERRATAFSTLFCAATTTLAFGLLAASRTPVLEIIGGTVAVGAVLAFALAALAAREPATPL